MPLTHSFCTPLKGPKPQTTPVLLQNGLNQPHQHQQAGSHWRPHLLEPSQVE